MNKDKKLVKFEGFLSSLAMPDIIESIYTISGLKDGHRDASEIMGIYRAESSDERFRNYFVLFKYENTFNLIAGRCEDINGEKCIDDNGQMIKIDIPSNIYYRSEMDIVPKELYVVKINKESSMNLWQMAAGVDDVLRKKNMNTHSAAEIESIVHMNNGEKTIATKSQALFDALISEFELTQIRYTGVKMHAIAKRCDASTPNNANGRKKSQKRKAERNRQEEPKRHQATTSNATTNGLRKLRITDETKKLLKLIASDDYEVYIKERDKDSFESLFE